MAKTEQPRTYLRINGVLVPVDPVNPSDPTTHPPGREIVIDHEGVLIAGDDAVGFALPEGFTTPDNSKIDKVVVVFKPQKKL